MDATTRARYGIAPAGAALAVAALLILTGPAGGMARANTMDTGGPRAATPTETAPTTTEATTATTTTEDPPATAPATSARRQPWIPTTEPPTTTTTAPPATTVPPATTTTTAPATTTTTTPPTTAPPETTGAPETSGMPMDMGFVAAASFAAPGTFSNPAKITIPEPGFVPPPWPGAPYPSVIAVSGLTGTVSDVNVILPKLDCARDPRSGEAWPEDFDLLLVGPSGANVVLISDVGGDDEVSRPAPSLALTLDDSAARALPSDAQLASGTFRPTDDDDDRAYDSDSSDKDGGPGRDLFPPGAPTPGSSSNLAVFNGTNPNGNWQLFASDDRAGFDRCEISNGWSLEIVTQAATQGTTGPGQTATTQPGATTVPGAGGPGTTTAPGGGGGTANASETAGTGTETARSAGGPGGRSAVAGASANRAVRTGPLASTGAPLALWTQTGFALMAAGTLLVRRTRKGWAGR